MPKNVVCKKCNNLVNGWCEKVIKYTCGAGTPEEAETNCTYFIRGECTSSFCEYRMKKQTNADRIRAMSDEELAVWLVKKTVYQESAFSCPSYLNFLTELDDTKESAIKGTVEWLQQPAEGDDYA